MSECPNALIIGAGKAGSTSLHNYLAAHPKIFGSDPKEIMYFTTHYGKGENWYRSHFPRQEGVEIYLESSPQYTFRDEFPKVPERIYNLLPKTKLIYVVREPISRIVSHYNHWAWSQPDTYNDIEASLASPEHQKYFVERSRYYYQISAYLDYFPSEQIHIVFTEDMKHAFQPTLDRTFHFLGVDRQAEKISSRIWNRREGKVWTKNHISDERRNKIRAYLRDDVQELFRYCGKAPDFWGEDYL